MSALSLAREHYRRRAQLVRSVEREAARMWKQVDRRDIAGSWTAQLLRLLALLTFAQRATAAEADAYLAAVTGLPAPGVNPDALAGIASDGRPLETLLLQPVVTSRVALAAGATESRALAAGQAALQMIVATQIADAGRVADGIAAAASRRVGYVRMVVGNTCSRCIVLAGKWYRWNQGFQRHPKCDCVHFPAAESVAGDLTTNPKALFDSMSREHQDKVFTRAGAQAIRDGADIYQVVNVRRGAHGLTPAGARLTAAEARALRNGLERGRLQTVRVYGQDLYVSTEGMTTRGIAGQRLGAREAGVKAGGRYRVAQAPRLMPESIYQIAGNDRDEAIRLLRRFGYIL